MTRTMEEPSLPKQDTSIERKDRAVKEEEDDPKGLILTPGPQWLTSQRVMLLSLEIYK